MKNTIIKYSLLAATALTMATGCKKFLDQEVPGKLSGDEFYKTDADAMQGTTAIYNALQFDYYTAWTSMYLVKTLPSDESNAAGSGASDQPAYQQIDKFSLDAENGAVLGAWRTCYYTIYRANQIVNYVQPENDLRKRLIGEAKAIRAHCYIDLVSLWGDVPLVLTDLAIADYNKTARVPKADVYAQIEKDLGEAIAVLPNKSDYPASDRFRVSKGSAAADLGKALLYQGKYAEAATALDGVISSGQYGLEASVGAAFSRAGEFGTESLFEVSYTDKISYDWGNFPWGSVPQSNIHVQLMGPRSDFYTKAPADSLIGGWGFNSPKPGLYNAFVAAGDVERRQATLMSEAELKAEGGNWSNPTAYDYEGFFQRKYGTYSVQTNGSGGAVPELNYGTNWRLMRYADVLLMAAEAFNKSGNDARAKTELNKVRSRSGLGDVVTSGDALFEDIVKERQMELAFEGVRFIDLVRWGRAATVLGPLGFVTGKHELLPIPAQDVRTAGLSQNPNY